jgi:hypothetical protein
LLVLTGLSLLVLILVLTALVLAELAGLTRRVALGTEGRRGRIIAAAMLFA